MRPSIKSIAPASKIPMETVVGHIPGLVSQIDYPYDLGVDVACLSPIFESPQADMGYDISDFLKVYARYGAVRDVRHPRGGLSFSRHEADPGIWSSTIQQRNINGSKSQGLRKPIQNVSRFGGDTADYWLSSQEVGMTHPQELAHHRILKILRAATDFYREAQHSGDAVKIASVMEGLQVLARDHSGLPFQWDRSAHRGFTSADATPWRRTIGNCHKINVEEQSKNLDSVLAFYKRLLKLRRESSDVFIHGCS